MTDQETAALRTMGHPFWDALRAACQEPGRATGLWARLREESKPLSVRPRRRTDVLCQRATFGGTRAGYVLRDARTGRSVRLSERDFEIWTLLDGRLSVGDLVSAYFRRHGTFALDRVLALLVRLREAGLLEGPSRPIFAQLDDEARRRTLSGRLGWVADRLGTIRLFEIGLGPAVDLVYRCGGWVVATRFFLLVCALLAALGGLAFGTLAGAGEVVLAHGGMPFAPWLLGVLLVNAVGVAVHEFAHALALRAVGCGVRGAGLMLHFGVPTFYVDTSDVWLQGRRSRAAVSWAGPFADLVLGGLASLAAVASPSGPLTPWWHTLALLCYLSAVVNLSPLLDLDGYYLLVDLLDVPMLRRRALALVGGVLRRGLLWPGSWTREERAAVVYLLLVGLWGAFAAVLGVFAWHVAGARLVADLWERGWWGRAVLFASAGCLGLALGAPVVRRAAWAVHRAARLTVWRRAADDPRALGIAAVGAAGLIAVLTWLVGPSAAANVRSIVAVVTLGFGIVVSARNTLWHAGSLLGWFFGLLATFQVALFASEVVRAAPAFSPGQPALADYGLRLASFVLFSGSALLFAVSVLWAWRAGERLPFQRLVVASLFVAGIVSAWIVDDWRLQPQGISLLARALAELLACVLFMLAALSLMETSYGVALVVMAGGVAAHAGSSLLVASASEVGVRWAAPVASLGYALLAGGLWLHWRIGRRPAPIPGGHGADLALSDVERVRRAANRLVEAILAQVVLHAGRRTAWAVAKRLNEFAGRSGWSVRIDLTTVVDLPSPASLDVARERRELLFQTIDLAAQAVGWSLVKRALGRAWDALWWEDREVLEGQGLVDGPWWSVDPSRRGDTGEVARALRHLPECQGLETAELWAVAQRCRRRRVRSGRALRFSSTPVRRWVIVRGTVEEAVDDRRVVLGVGDVLPRGAPWPFGRAILQYRAITPVELAEVPSETALAPAARDVGRSVPSVRALQRVPLFARLSPAQLRRVASLFRFHEVPPGALVARADAGCPLGVVVSGRIGLVVEHPREGTWSVVDLVAGDLIGETRAPVGGLDVRYVAVERSTVLLLERAALADLIAQRLLDVEFAERALQRRSAMLARSLTRRDA